jgi:hypothetical protein
MNHYKTRVCLGISVDPRAGIKIAVLGTKDLESPWPLELRSFPNLECFEVFWLDWLERQYRLDRVGVAVRDSDDLGLLDWLPKQGIETKGYAVGAFTFYPQAQQYKVPGPFEDAYDQALACLLRTRAKEFTSLVVAEARRIENALRENISQLDCLAAALSDDDYCSF